MKKSLFSMIVLGFAVAASHAQTTPSKTVHRAAAPPVAAKAPSTGPSMEEAVAFLRDTIAPDCTYYAGRCTSVSMIVGADNILRYRREGLQRNGSEQAGPGFSGEVIDLRLLYPASVKVTALNLTGQSLSVAAKGDVKAIVSQTDSNPEVVQATESFAVYSAELMENARKALTYIVELAQGTPSEKTTREFVEAKETGVESPASTPRLFDTLDYITKLLTSHGCAEHRWHDSWSDSEGNHNENDVSRGCTSAYLPTYYRCSRSFTVSRSGVFFDGKSNSGGYIGLKLGEMDPASARQTDADLPIETPRAQDNVNVQELGMGRMVKFASTDGVKTYGPFYMDTPENADHLINALTHAIQLCGGKKAAF